MSYCRWSSNGFRSDLYVYADVEGGVTIHVAERRRVFPEDFPPDPIEALVAGKISAEAYAARNKTWQARLDQLPLVPIGLGRDGETFRVAAFDEAADLVADLRAEGYLVPDGVEAALRADAEEGADHD